MYKVEFIKDASTLPKTVETVELGKASGFGQRYTELLVYQADKAFLRLICYGSSAEYRFTQEALIWSDWVIVGLGHGLYLYELKKHISKIFDLGAYFCKFHATANCLFAASGQNIHAFNSQGELLWVSNMLGIDGVVINEITEDFLLGEGEFDPPGGWKPFKINLTDGKVDWL